MQMWIEQLCERTPRNEICRKWKKQISILFLSLFEDIIVSLSDFSHETRPIFLTTDCKYATVSYLSQAVEDVREDSVIRSRLKDLSHFCDEVGYSRRLEPIIYVSILDTERERRKKSISASGKLFMKKCQERFFLTPAAKIVRNCAHKLRWDRDRDWLSPPISSFFPSCSKVKKIIPPPPRSRLWKNRAAEGEFFFLSWLCRQWILWRWRKKMKKLFHLFFLPDNVLKCMQQKPHISPLRKKRRVKIPQRKLSRSISPI